MYNTEEEIYDKDGDGRESVSEYIEKKKMKTNAKPDTEEQPKEKTSDKDKEFFEKAKNVVSGVGNAVGNVASVMTAIPHVAAFGAAMGTTALAKIIADELKKKWNIKD